MKLSHFIEDMTDLSRAERAENILLGVLSNLRNATDNAYKDYIDHERRDECLGWEAKIDRGEFGEKELKAHRLAAEKLGAYRALGRAATLLEDELHKMRADES